MNGGLLLVIGVAAAVIALVWYFFMAPLEKEMHERRMEMIRRKIEKRRQRVDDEGDSAEQ